ncbi:hypothetical protein ACIQMR_37390 [Streptomyces sp. NPDC091376]|uniref:hypothetical protein n=1 Tax=Streptomyces sp. NPDC091376 TaxID=3365994 RepID=UPI003808F4EF
MRKDVTQGGPEEGKGKEGADKRRSRESAGLGGPTYTREAEEVPEKDTRQNQEESQKKETGKGKQERDRKRTNG